MFKEKLEKLLEKRKENTSDIFNEMSLIQQMNEEIVAKELHLKIEFENEISSADQATIKTKYSNAEKRRIELEKKLSFDVQLKTLKSGLLERQNTLLTFETQDKILKLEEKYLFRMIDLYLSEKTLGGENEKYNK